MSFDFIRNLSYSICIHIGFVAFCLITGFYGTKLHKNTFTDKSIEVSTISLKHYQGLQNNKISNKTQIIKTIESNKKQKAQAKVKLPTVIKRASNIENAGQEALLKKTGVTTESAPTNTSQGLEITPNLPTKEQQIKNEKQEEIVSQKDDIVPHISPTATAQEEVELKNQIDKDLKSDDILNINNGTQEDLGNTKEKNMASIQNINVEEEANSTSKQNSTNTVEGGEENKVSLQEIFASNTDLLKGDTNTISIQHFITLKFMKCWEKYQNNSKLLAKTEVDLEVQFAQDGTVMSMEEKEPYIQTTEEELLYKEMLDNAKSCIYECSPITDVPISRYNEWRIVHFHFHNKTT